MATGRIGGSGDDGVDLTAQATALDAEANISAVAQIGGISGSTTEPCFGFVHNKATGTATTDIDNAVDAVATAAYLPGEAAEA